MSRSQGPTFQPPRVAGGRPAPPHTSVAANIRVSNNKETQIPDPARLVIGGDLHCELLAAQSLKKVTHDMEDCSLKIKHRLETCKLTKAQEVIKKELYQDIGAIQKVIVAVMHTHRGIANTIRRTTRLPAPNGMHDVSNLLNQALDYMEVASSNLTDLTGKLVTSSSTFKDQAEPSRTAFKALCHTLVNLKGPQAITYAGYTISASSVVYQTVNARDIADQQVTATVFRGILAITGAIVTSTMANVLNNLGSEADLYKPEARKATKEALIGVHVIVHQLAQVLGYLNRYWSHSHDRIMVEGNRPADYERLQRIASMLDREVDNCLEMALSIQKHLPLAGTEILPTRSEIEEERTAMALGIPGLPNYPNRAITYGGTRHLSD